MTPVRSPTEAHGSVVAQRNGPPVGVDDNQDLGSVRGRPPRRLEDSVRSFWAKVDRSLGEGCWEWTGSRDVTGYGILRLDGRLQKAHRIAWLLTNGNYPSARLRHGCRNPRCVRPDHLVNGKAVSRFSLLDHATNQGGRHELEPHGADRNGASHK